MDQYKKLKTEIAEKLKILDSKRYKKGVEQETCFLKFCLRPDVGERGEKRYARALDSMGDSIRPLLYADFCLKQKTAKGLDFAYDALLKAEMLNSDPVLIAKKAVIAAKQYEKQSGGLHSTQAGEMYELAQRQLKKIERLSGSVPSRINSAELSKVRFLNADTSYRHR